MFGQAFLIGGIGGAMFALLLIAISRALRAVLPKPLSTVEVRVPDGGVPLIPRPCDGCGIRSPVKRIMYLCDCCVTQVRCGECGECGEDE